MRRLDRIDGGAVKTLVAMVAALVVALTLAGLPFSGAHAEPRPADFAGQRPMPEATKKKTPKATAKPTATPSVQPTATPVPMPTRRPVDEEGERWVRIAMIAGGGLLGIVLVFFGIGSLLRYTGRRRSAR